MNSTKKKLLLCFAAISLVALLGAGKKSLELLNDYKLIDLKAAIELTLPGAESGDSEEKPTKETEEIKPQKENTNNRTDSQKKFVVRVENEQIILNGTDKVTLEELLAILTKESKIGNAIILTDDYAEAHAYKEIRNALREFAYDRSMVFTEK